MAEIKTNIPIEIKMGNAGTGDTNLPAFKEGSIIFTKDTKKIYIDPVGETERIAVGGTEVDLSGKQDKIGILTTLEFESGGISRVLDLGGHTEDYLYIQGGPLVVNNLRVTAGADNSFSAGVNTATFEHNVKVFENMSVGQNLITSVIKSSNSDSAILYLESNGVEISQARTLNFTDKCHINNLRSISGDGNSLYLFAGSLGGSSFINIDNKKYVKIGNYDSGQQPIPLLGISTPISSADTTLGITADGLPYQAANKKYVDTQVANKQDKFAEYTSIRPSEEAPASASTNILVLNEGMEFYLRDRATNPLVEFKINNAGALKGTTDYISLTSKKGFYLKSNTFTLSNDKDFPFQVVMDDDSKKVVYYGLSGGDDNGSLYLTNTSRTAQQGATLQGNVSSDARTTALVVNESNTKLLSWKQGTTTNNAPLLGVSTPVTVEDTTLGITTADLPYQATNKKYVDDAISTQISSVYKAKGSIADLTALPTPDKAHEGFVYNIESEFTTTGQFVEGTGKTYPAGTNVVCINTTGTTYKWDVLAGMVDLSNYATKKYVDDAIGNITALFASLVDMNKTTQADEPTDDTEIVNEPTADEGGLN